MHSNNSPNSFKTAIFVTYMHTFLETPSNGEVKQDKTPSKRQAMLLNIVTSSTAIKGRIGSLLPPHPISSEVLSP
eukprot:212620-Amphidinium_carterae.1